MRQFGAMLLSRDVQPVGRLVSTDEGWWVVASRPGLVAAALAVHQRLRAIGQPLRVLLVIALDRRGEASVSELADEAGLSRFEASQHLAVLRDSGVVVRRKDGRRQLYRLADAGQALRIYEEVVGDLAALDGSAREQPSGGTDAAAPTLF